MTGSKLVVTSEQLGEGWYEFADGVVINRQFTGVIPIGGGRYAVDDPKSSVPRIEPDDRFPVVDCRGATVVQGRRSW